MYYIYIYIYIYRHAIFQSIRDAMESRMYQRTIGSVENVKCLGDEEGWSNVYFAQSEEGP